MENPLSPNVRIELIALARSISVSHGADADVHEELLSHLEDTYLRTRERDEAASEAEALEETRRHFGNPVLIESLLRQVHGPEFSLGLFRRFAAASIATLAMHGVWCALVSVLMMASGITGSESLRHALPLGLGLVYLLLSAGLLGVFRRWQSQVRQGAEPWFVRWSLVSLAGCALTLFLLIKLVPTETLAKWSYFPMVEISFWTRTLKPVNLILVPLALGVQCAAWIWWFSRTFRAGALRASGFVLWASLFALLSLVPPFFYGASGKASALAGPHAMGIGKYLIARGPSFPLFIGAPAQNASALYYLSLNLGLALVSGFLAWSLYLLCTYFQRVRALSVR